MNRFVYLVSYRKSSLASFDCDEGVKICTSMKEAEKACAAYHRLGYISSWSRIPELQFD